MTEIFRATQAFAFTDKNGTPRSVCAGDLFSSDDPDYKGKEHLFETVEVAAARASKAATGKATTSKATETASAAPGEQRARSAPEKKAAPAKAAPKEGDK